MQQVRNYRWPLIVSCLFLLVSSKMHSAASPNLVLSLCIITKDNSTVKRDVYCHVLTFYFLQTEIKLLLPAAPHSHVKYQKAHSCS